MLGNSVVGGPAAANGKNVTQKKHWKHDINIVKPDCK